MHTGALPQIVARVLRAIGYAQYSAGWLIEPDGTAEFWAGLGVNALEVRRASGDPAITFDIGGVDKFVVGVDDDDSDKFKINDGALANPSALELDGSGNVEIGGTLTALGGAAVTGAITGASLDVTGEAEAQSIEVTIASGDPVITFDIGGTDKFVLGVDDSDADQFKIHSGALADPSLLELSSAGVLSLAGDVMASGRGKGLQAQLDSLALYTQSGELDLTTAVQDVGGLTTGAFTPAVNEVIHLAITVQFLLGEGTAPCVVGDRLRFFLYRNADLTRSFYGEAPAVDGGITYSMAWKADINADTEYTWKVRAQNVDGDRGSVYGGDMTVWRLSR